MTYIKKQPLLEKCKSLMNSPFASALMLAEIEKAEEEDVVPIEAYKQIKWELDIAIEQLQSYGVGFAEKKELIEVKHGEWKVKVFPLTNCKKVYCDCGYYENKGPAWEMHWGMHNYCPNCGAKMDGGNAE